MGQHETVSEPKSPVEHAVDLIVYAPIGVVSEARRLLPSFVDKGRARVDMYKLIGRFAVKQGQTTARKRIDRTQEQVDSLLTEFGLRPADPPSVLSDPVGTDPVVTDADSASPDPAPTPRSGPAAADLPLADYDSLAASQVIPRLSGLDKDELEAVRAYEAAHRGRKTILGKLAQLQSA